MYVISYKWHCVLYWTLPVYVNAYLALYVYSLISVWLEWLWTDIIHPVSMHEPSYVPERKIYRLFAILKYLSANTQEKTLRVLSKRLESETWLAPGDHRLILFNIFYKGKQHWQAFDWHLHVIGADGYKAPTQRNSRWTWFDHCIPGWTILRSLDPILQIHHGRIGLSRTCTCIRIIGCLYNINYVR